MQKKKGISLIVLVITIIVMIILAATIIISINNANVMEKANEAVAKTDKVTVQEIADEAWTTAYGDGKRTQIDLENAVTEALEGVDLKECVVTVTTKGVKVLNKKIDWIQNKTEIKKDNMVLEVGQKLKNTTGLPEGYDWYILGAEDGKLLITTNVNILENYTIDGSKETFIPKPDGDYTKDTDQYGYSNAVLNLNKQCTNLIKGGSEVEKVRSIRVEDINRVTGYIPKVGTKVGEYGVEVNPGVTYPDKTTPTGVIKSNYYYYYPKTLTTSSNGDMKGIATTSPAYIMLFRNPEKTDNVTYWLASSYVGAGSGRAGFGLNCVGSGSVSSGNLWYSYDGFTSHSRGVRPAVTLKSDFIPEV